MLLFVVCVVIYSIFIITAKQEPSSMLVITAKQEPSKISVNYTTHNKQQQNLGPGGGYQTSIWVSGPLGARSLNSFILCNKMFAPGAPDCVCCSFCQFVRSFPFHRNKLPQVLQFSLTLCLEWCLSSCRRLFRSFPFNRNNLSQVLQFSCIFISANLFDFFPSMEQNCPTNL